MESERLTEFLSKMPATPPRMWSIKNFLCLLDYIDLQIYKPLFESESIDGSVFFDLELTDFPDMKKLHFRNIQLWIEDLKQVQKNREKNHKKIQSSKQSKNSSAKKSRNAKPLASSETNSFESKIIPGLKFELGLLREDNKFEKICFEKSFQHMGEVQLREMKKSPTNKEIPPSSPKKNKTVVNLNKLILDHCSSNIEYTISNRGGIVGRDISCEISIKNRELSRKNSEFAFSKGVFYLADKKSYNGTFIKMNENFNSVLLRKGMTFEVEELQIMLLESNPLKVKISDFRKEVGWEETMDLQEGSWKFCLDSQNKRKYNLSCQNSEKFAFQFCKINKKPSVKIPKDNEFDVWFKILDDQWFPLVKNMKIKASDEEFEIKECPPPSLRNCTRCNNLANSIILPCKHNAVCLKCGQKIDDCPECKEQIETIQEIFLDYLQQN